MVSFSTKNLAPAFISIFPFGQLIARIFFLDGSLDKWWLLIPIFYIPPISFVAAIMIGLGLVAKGKGGKPYDSYINLPIFLLIIKQFINFTPIGNNMWYKIISSIIIFGSIIFILLWKRHNIINEQIKKEGGKEEKDKQFSNCDSAYNPKVLINTTVTSINIYMITLMLTGFIKFVIFVVIFKGRLRSKVVNNIFNIILLPMAIWCVYVFNNMILQNDLNEMCAQKWFFESKIKIIILIVAIIYGIISIIFSKKGSKIKKSQGLSKTYIRSPKLRKKSIVEDDNLEELGETPTKSPKKTKLKSLEDDDLEELDLGETPTRSSKKKLLEQLE